VLEEYRDSLRMIFLVSQVSLSPNGMPAAPADGKAGTVGKEGALAGLRVTVARADGQKCERCWNYSVRVGESAEFPTLCERCVGALGEMEDKS
jgi:isoleucyl-tRNA synthetase